MPTGIINKFVPIEDKEKLAYIAALIDMMGSFSIMRKIDKKGRVHWGARVSFSSKDARIINFLSDSFCMTGGRSIVYDRRPYVEDNWSRPSDEEKFECHVWCICGDLLELVLTSCYRWLILKKDHADIMLLYLTTQNSFENKKKISEENIKIRIKCAQELYKLNRITKRKNTLE